jgi:hypothetical protein
LLAPTAPPHSQLDILYSRVWHDPEWGPQARALRAARARPALTNLWPLPDLPDPALRHVIAHEAKTVVVGPILGYLASRFPRLVLTRSSITGHHWAALTGKTGAAVAIAPDGTWLTSGDHNGPVRIWDVATGEQRAALGRGPMMVSSLTVGPDGTWLASSSYESVSIWDTATVHLGTTATRHARPASFAFVCDGARLATVGYKGSVRIWDIATGKQRAVLATDTGRMPVVAPDGTWLATTDDNGSVRIWDPATGQQRSTLVGHTDVVGRAAVAPDGTWLATAGTEGSVRIWDVATGEQRAALPTDTRTTYRLLVAPDGTWLATIGTTVGDETARFWDPATGQRRADRTGLVQPLAVAPDGT